MLDRRAGSDRLKSMHLVLLVFKSNWRPRKESCMALKLAWRVVRVCVDRHKMYYVFNYHKLFLHIGYWFVHFKTVFCYWAIYQYFLSTGSSDSITFNLNFKNIPEITMPTYSVYRHPVSFAMDSYFYFKLWRLVTDTHVLFGCLGDRSYSMVMTRRKCTIHHLYGLSLIWMSTLNWSFLGISQPLYTYFCTGKDTSLQIEKKTQLSVSFHH